MLNDLLLKHKASLLLYNEIIVLVSSYISSPSFNKLDKFKSRRSLLLSTEKSLNTSCLRPVNGTVRLHNDSLVTVPIFDAKHMITSLLTDPSLMKESKIDLRRWMDHIKPEHSEIRTLKQSVKSFFKPVREWMGGTKEYKPEWEHSYFPPVRPMEDIIKLTQGYRTSRNTEDPRIKTKVRTIKREKIKTC